ncbi:MAG: hypothetical protein F6K19_22725, partial [Cyanothece sp. SIO1E1]|nr:hypothetical protein [Cyanothece sp. SIO1E1]
MNRVLVKGSVISVGSYHWLGVGSLVGLLIGLSSTRVMAQSEPGSGATRTNNEPIVQVIPPPLSRPILQLGSQGTVVAELQAVLKLLGYYQDAVNGVYQASTATAVSAFQQAA